MGPHAPTSTIAPMSAPESASAIQSTIVVACSLAMMSALILGVGIPNHMVLRHVVQTLPIWGVVILGARRSRVAGWVGLPVFVFWLVSRSAELLSLRSLAYVRPAWRRQGRIALT